LKEDLNVITKDKTIITISHKIDDLEADKILVFENGRIVQRGTREELERDENGLFHRLEAP